MMKEPTAFHLYKRRLSMIKKGQTFTSGRSRLKTPRHASNCRTQTARSLNSFQWSGTRSFIQSKDKEEASKII
ncbi:hypothetical protein PO124_14155 [Bacillus licheniformis]|nr:hypothetical protein [Bacillus licheniformis]